MNNNNFNMNNPFLALDNNNAPKNEPVNYQQNNQVTSNNNMANQNVDQVLGINQFNKTEDTSPKNDALDAILGLNNSGNNTNMDSSIPNTTPNEEVNNNNLDAILGINNANPTSAQPPKEESKDSQLDAILGLNQSPEEQNNIHNNNQNNIQNNNQNNNQYQNVPNIQAEPKYTKAQKTLHNDFIVLFILELIVLGFTLSDGTFNIFTIVFAVLAVLEIYLTSINSKYSWIIGLIFGIGMISTIVIGDIIDALLGLFVTLHSIMCIIENKKLKKKNKNV